MNIINKLSATVMKEVKLIMGLIAIKNTIINDCNFVNHFVKNRYPKIKIRIPKKCINNLVLNSKELLGNNLYVTNNPHFSMGKVPNVLKMPFGLSTGFDKCLS